MDNSPLRRDSIRFLLEKENYNLLRAEEQNFLKGIANLQFKVFIGYAACCISGFSFFKTIAIKRVKRSLPRYALELGSILSIAVIGNHLYERWMKEEFSSAAVLVEKHKFQIKNSIDRKEKGLKRVELTDEIPIWESNSLAGREEFLRTILMLMALINLAL